MVSIVGYGEEMELGMHVETLSKVRAIAIAIPQENVRIESMYTGVQQNVRAQGCWPKGLLQLQELVTIPSAL